MTTRRSTTHVGLLYVTLLSTVSRICVPPHFPFPSVLQLSLRTSFLMTRVHIHVSRVMARFHARMAHGAAVPTWTRARTCTDWGALYMHSAGYVSRRPRCPSVAPLSPVRSASSSLFRTSPLILPRSRFYYIFVAHCH